MSWFKEAAAMVSSQVCDACGNPTDIYLWDANTPASVGTAWLCTTCMGYSNGECERRILARRAANQPEAGPQLIGWCDHCEARGPRFRVESEGFAGLVCATCRHHFTPKALPAKQPEAGPVVLSSEGRPIAVGDKMQWPGGEWACVVTSIGDFGKDSFAATITKASDPDRVGATDYGPLMGPCWVHATPSPAKPPGGEVEHQCARNGMHLMKDDRCVECGEDPRVYGAAQRNGTISGKQAARTRSYLLPSEALAEVERQVALVKRLSFDLTMLRLLGRGYSRNDLLADLARKSKEGK